MGARPTNQVVELDIALARRRRLVHNRVALQVNSVLSGMSTTFSVLACAKGHLEDLGLVLLMVAAWIFSGIAAIANAGLIFVLPRNRYFKLINGGIWLSYIAAIIELVAGWATLFPALGDWGPPFLVFGVPAMVIAHFTYLVLACRKRPSRNPEPSENAT